MLPFFTIPIETALGKRARYVKTDVVSKNFDVERFDGSNDIQRGPATPACVRAS